MLMKHRPGVDGFRRNVQLQQYRWVFTKLQQYSCVRLLFTVLALQILEEMRRDSDGVAQPGHHSTLCMSLVKTVVWIGLHRTYVR